MQPPIHLNALLFASLFIAASYQGNQEDSLIGNWTGTSSCQIKNSSCRDENVVFHISLGSGANHYRINADKIVNGQVINMGELDFLFDKASHTLTCGIPTGTWVLVVNKRHIDGTLTTPDKLLFRKLSLSRAG
jgi:hypothetical protein